MILNNCPFVISICKIGRDKYVENKASRRNVSVVKVNIVINIP